MAPFPASSSTLSPPSRLAGNTQDGKESVRGDPLAFDAIPDLMLRISSDAVVVDSKDGMGFARGALHVIAKPFDPVTLSTTIRRIWADQHE